MLKINNISNYIYKNQETNIKKVSKENTKEAVEKDTFDSLTYKNGSIDFKQLTNLTIESLKNSYKDINIVLGNLSDKELLEEYAKLSNGKNLIISSDFIQKMQSSAESYEKGKTILEQVLNQLSQNNIDFKSIGAYVDEKGVTYWSSYEKPKFDEDEQKINRLIETMKQMEKQMQEIKDKFKVKINSSIYNSPAEVYAKLAQASTIPDVKGVVSTAEHNIYVLKSALGTCDKKDRNKIRAAIAQLEKAVGRAAGKVKDLTNEGNMKAQQKKAKMLNEEKKAERIRIELERQKTMRHSRERAQIEEGRPIFYYPEEFMDKKFEYTEEELEAYYPELAGMDIAASPEISVATESTPVEVNVCETVEISI